MDNQINEVGKNQNGNNFEQVLMEYNNENRMSAHGMIKKLSETASWEDKVNFAEYVLFVESKYKESFLEDFAIEYIISGTDKEEKSASELLIRYVLKEKLSFALLEKACRACQKLIDASPDEEEKSKYVQWMDRLEQQRQPQETEVQETEPQEEKIAENVIVQEHPQEVTEEKETKKQKEPVVYTQNDKIASILSVVSSVLWMIVFVYLLIDIHSDVWATSAALHWIPSLPLGTEIGIPFYGEYLGASGIFAMVLAIVASALTSTGKWCNYLTYATIIKTISDIFSAVIIVLHMYLQHWKRLSMFENVLEYLLMIGISILIGSIIGGIIRKILKWDVVKNVQ